MTPEAAIGVLESINAKTDYLLITDDARSEALDMAISALQAREAKYSTESSLTQKGLDTISLQPTCNNLATDTISRQAIINSFRYDDDGTAWDMDDIVYRLEQFPSAQPEQRWIPCSERLPDTPIRVQVQLDSGWIITAYRQEDEWLSVPDCGEALHDEWVVAWIPLPEPYRAERRTDD